jgi:hypothetical protein
MMPNVIDGNHFRRRFRGSKVIPMKATVDEALVQCYDCEKRDRDDAHPHTGFICSKAAILGGKTK